MPTNHPLVEFLSCLDGADSVKFSKVRLSRESDRALVSITWWFLQVENRQVETHLMIPLFDSRRMCGPGTFSY